MNESASVQKLTEEDTLYSLNQYIHVGYGGLQSQHVDGKHTAKLTTKRTRKTERLSISKRKTSTRFKKIINLCCLVLYSLLRVLFSSSSSSSSSSFYRVNSFSFLFLITTCYRAAPRRAVSL